ncbi:ABC transporter permease subunit [Thauera sp. SDU_THAU2]|uniref:ABC transporter permease subunit n=1 Tax=Thauera sp. SDU_THAU2 TaxID=3136633 RepID=UPI00311F54EC
MNAASEKKGAAWLFMQWATSKQVALAGAVGGKLVNPPRTSTWNDKAWLDYAAQPEFNNFVESFKATQDRAALAFTPRIGFGEAMNAWAVAIQKMVNVATTWRRPSDRWPTKSAPVFEDDGRQPAAALRHHDGEYHDGTSRFEAGDGRADRCVRRKREACRSVDGLSDRRVDWLSLAVIAPAVLILVGFLLLFFYGVWQSLTDLRLGRPAVGFVGPRQVCGARKEPGLLEQRAGDGHLCRLGGRAAGVARARHRQAVRLRRFPGAPAAADHPPAAGSPAHERRAHVDDDDEPQSGVLNSLFSLVGLGPYAWISGSGDVATLGRPHRRVDIHALLRAHHLRGPPGHNRRHSGEAARINGAKAWATFARIELPLVAPYILIAAVFQLIGSMNQFDIIFGTTQGGPGNSTAALSVQAYLTAFRNLPFGRGAALMVVNWLIVVVGAFLMVRAWQAVRRRVN